MIVVSLIVCKMDDNLRTFYYFELELLYDILWLILL